MSSDDVLVIGAGPFGLSISAHLASLGVGHTVVGRPMDSWLRHMPSGMFLRSEPYGSDMAAPHGGHDLRAYCAGHGLEHVHRLGPLSIERFRDYSAWYTSELVPATTDATVVSVSPTEHGFHVDLEGGDRLTAATVVVAPGLLPFTVLPEALAGLSADLATHVSAHHDLTVFAGKRVAVVGGGQSALETLALLHEAGADAQLVMRREAINWLDPNPAELGPLGHLRRPVNKLCEGWHCTVWNSPAAFRRLPRSMRVDKARSVLGPAGAWWLKDRVDGVIETHTGHTVRGATPHGSGVRLALEGPTTPVLDVDHVIAGTGFRVDLTRLGFLGPDLQRRVDTISGYPVLNRAGESSVAGLYFAGAAAAYSLGPSVRFIAGTHTSVHQLARSVARRPGVGAHPVGVGGAHRSD